MSNNLPKVLETIKSFTDTPQTAQSVRVVVNELANELDTLFTDIVFSDFTDCMVERDALAFIVAVRKIQESSELLKLLTYDIK